jgi:hypothetical protein
MPDITAAIKHLYALMQRVSSWHSARMRTILMPSLRVTGNDRIRHTEVSSTS